MAFDVNALPNNPAAFRPFGGLLGGLFGAPTNPINLFAGSQTGQLTNVPYANADDLTNAYNRLVSSGVDPMEAQRQVGQVATASNRNGIPLESLYQQADQMAARRDQLHNIDSYEQSGLDYFYPQLDRLNKVLSNDPNAIRTDAEYGAILSGLENQLQGAARQSQQNIRQSQAASGGGALSGIANRQALATESGRQLGLQNVLSGVKNAAFQRRDTLGQGLMDWRQAANRDRNSILGMPQPSSLDNLSLGWGINQQRFGQQQQPLQMALSSLGGILGTAGNMANGGMSNAMGLMSMMGGR